MAIYLANGSVINQLNGLIAAIGTSGVGIEMQGAGTLGNAGIIEALNGGTDVAFGSGGSLENSGTLPGGTTGVVLTGGAASSILGTRPSSGLNGTVSNIGTSALIMGVSGIGGLGAM